MYAVCLVCGMLYTTCCNKMLTKIVRDGHFENNQNRFLPQIFEKYLQEVPAIYRLFIGN